MSSSSRSSRRMLALGVLFGAGLAVALSAVAARAPVGRASAKAPEWKLAVQAYTFNRFTFFEAIEKAKAAGVKYIEAYPGQRLSPEKRNVSFDHDASWFPIFSGRHQNRWFDCAECHTNPADFTEFTCFNCHAHNQTSMDNKHSSVSGYAYDSAACYTCHPGGTAP